MHKLMSIQCNVFGVSYQKCLDRFDENLLNSVDNITASSRLSRSAVVREALKNWIRQREIQAFENEWIRKLKKNPDELVGAVFNRDKKAIRKQLDLVAYGIQ
jgi:Arc/MetJ-type ribon-helix-helix transcriptional regulator